MEHHSLRVSLSSLSGYSQHHQEAEGTQDLT